MDLSTILKLEKTMCPALLAFSLYVTLCACALLAVLIPLYWKLRNDRDRGN